MSDPRRSGGNPGLAGPKGALAEKPKRTGDGPRGGAAGNEGGNTRRDFVKLPKKK